MLHATAVILSVCLKYAATWSRAVLEKLTRHWADQEIPCILWKPKTSLPHSKSLHQSLSVRDRWSPHFPTYSIQVVFYYYSVHSQVIPVASFLPTSSMHFCSSQAGNMVHLEIFSWYAVTVYFTAAKMPCFGTSVCVYVSFSPIFPLGNILCKGRPYGSDLRNIPVWLCCMGLLHQPFCHSLSHTQTHTHTHTHSLAEITHIVQRS